MKDYFKFLPFCFSLLTSLSFAQEKTHTFSNTSYLHPKHQAVVASSTQTASESSEEEPTHFEINLASYQVDTSTSPNGDQRLSDPEKEVVTAFPGKFSLMAFYTVSKGDFKETAPGRATINTKQNSPGTLGLFGNYRPYLAHYSWQGSIYAAKLQGSKTSFSQQIEPPMEFGANAYWQYENRNLSYSAGLDFERFSNYSASSIGADGIAQIKNQTITFATIGIGRFTPIKNWNLLTKISVSTSLMKTDFGGQKGIIYVGLFSPWKWQVHALYKMHRLESDDSSKLNISRFGIGFGYLFF